MTTADSAFPDGMTIPNGSKLERIESRYGPLRDVVQCGLCGTPHKRGYIVVFSRTPDAPPERAIIGHVCGRREFGEMWTQAVGSHEAKVRAVETRAELERFLESAPGAENRLRMLIPQMEVYNAIKQILLVDAREFMRHCASACRSADGRLERFGYPNPEAYRLEGRSFFVEDSNLGRAKRILNGIEQVKQAAEQPDTRTRKIRQVLSQLGNLRLSIEEIEKQVADWAAALRPTNFQRAIRVLDYGSGGIRMNGTVLEVQRLLAGYDWIRVADLANPQMPSKASSWSW